MNDCRYPLFVLAVVASLGSPIACAGDPAPIASPDAVKAFLEQRGKVVLTFIGYSGSGYEDEEGMLDEAAGVLAVHSPRKTIVNIGATPDGIGQVYAVAKKMGFETSGIVSTQARHHGADISPHVDKVFFVEDATWGGFLPDTNVLSPTSQAMIECSDVVVGIGGGAVGRDEMIAAERLGKAVVFIPADMNHARAVEKASKKGRPAPDFRGEAHLYFRKDE